MGAKHCKTTNRDNQFIQKVMKKRREGVESKQLANENTFDDVQTRHEISKLLRSEVVTRKGVNQEVCNVVARTITKLTKKELFSTISYFQWEQQLINSLQDDTNQEFVLQVESQRISYLLFSDFPNNFFVRLMHSFEAAVAIKYESVVRLTMTECCEKFRIMSYKKVPMPQMIALMKKLCYKDLTKMESTEHLATVKQAFTEIVTMMKYMGVFFTKLLIFIYTGKTKGNFRSDYHTLSLIMNTMLVPDYIYERYASFFAKVILHEDMQKWFDNRKILIKQKRAFTDLIYLNQFIIEEDKKRLIRKNTHATMSFSHIGGAKELGAHINSKTMDINEFLAHLEVQVDLDLDEIFTKNLQSILEYFRGIDKFIDMTFKNTELEIKIDLMRLILRMTTSTKFVIYIYVLSSMKVDFLNECQIFALFCQVLLNELKKPLILEEELRDTTNGKPGEVSATLLQNMSRQGSILVNFPPPVRKSSISDFCHVHAINPHNSVPDRKSREFFRFNDGQVRGNLDSSSISTEKETNVTASCQNLHAVSPSGFWRSKTSFDMKRLSSYDSTMENAMLQMTHLVRSGQIAESDNEDEDEGESSNSRDSPINLRKLMYEPKRISEPESTPSSLKTPEPKALKLNLFKIATGESGEERRECGLESLEVVKQPKETPAFFFKQLSDIPEVTSPENRATMPEFEVRTSSPVFEDQLAMGSQKSLRKPLSKAPNSLVIESAYSSDLDDTPADPDSKPSNGFSAFVRGFV